MHLCVVSVAHPEETPLFATLLDHMCDGGVFLLGFLVAFVGLSCVRAYRVAISSSFDRITSDNPETIDLWHSIHVCCCLSPW